MLFNRLKTVCVASLATIFVLGSSVSASYVSYNDRLSPSKASVLKVGESVDIDVDDGGYLYKFIPSETGSYIFQIDNFDEDLSDGAVVIYENNITQDSDFYSFSGDKSFGIEMIKGRTYYIFARSSSLVDGIGSHYSMKITGCVKPGWNKINGIWYFYRNDFEKLTGISSIGGSCYIFNDNGEMNTGWIMLYGDWFYCGPDGRVFTGWHKLGNDWYYFTNSIDVEIVGIMYTGLNQIGDYYYYFDENGHMVSNRWIVESDTKFLYADENGHVFMHGWKKLGGVWYYFSDGYAVVNRMFLISSSYYYFDASGHMRTGWIQDSRGEWLYGNPDGELVIGWKQINGYWYYSQYGYMLNNCWCQIDGVEYYFLPSCEMATGWQKFDGSWYYFESNGIYVKGWKKLSGVWYYFDEGEMLTGVQVIDGIRYEFDESGHLINS